MLELASVRDGEELHNSSPLMMDDPQQSSSQEMVQVQRPKNEDDDDGEDNFYGAYPLSSVNGSKLRKPSSLSHPPESESPAITTRSTNNKIMMMMIRRKLMLLLPLLLSLYMLTDSDYQQREGAPPKRHHLAFVTALSRHPPSLRVFRIASEGAFLLFCAAFALWVWEEAGKQTQPHDHEHKHEHEGEGEGDADPYLENDKSRGGIDNPHENYDKKLRITPQAVGELLFSPPPNSITSNATWEILHRRHRLFVRRRKRNRRKQSSDDIGSGDNNESESNGSSGLDITAGKDSAHEIDDLDHDIIVQSTTDEDEDELLLSEQQQQHNPLPPSSTSVLGAAFDVSTVTCIFLIFFTISSAEGGRYIDQRLGKDSNSHSHQSWMKFIANIAAPLFPLTLFLLSLIALTVPYPKRKTVWTIVSLTIGAPNYPVTFRDGFIGDILTSTVRPLQDLAFITVFFLPMGLVAWWSRELYTLDAADVPLERSWILHTVLLPGCTLSPLWWRFLQNLRQCYDAKQRWPYLGNALKYFLTAEVAIFGVFDPNVKSSPIWITCFFATTLYQIWWDVFMDWGLLEKKCDFSVGWYYHSNATAGKGGGGSTRWFWWWPYSLRSQRLYSRDWVYYLIFAINFCLRFVGMITLIPPVYLSRTTGLIVNTYNDLDFQLFVGSMVACAEIFRRTIWALLRLEWEVIKTSAESKKNEVRTLEEDNDGIDSLWEEEGMKPMDIATAGAKHHRRPFPFAAIKRQFSIASLGDMSSLNDIQILSELCVWATVFSGIAIIAAAHREVL